jgi:hypothetical protein
MATATTLEKQDKQSDQYNTKKLTKNSSSLVAGPVEGSMDVNGLDGNPGVAFTDNSLQAHAVQLGTADIPVAQRQRMAQQMAHVAGNRYLQQVVLQTQQSQKAVDDLIDAPVSEIGDKLDGAAGTLQQVRATQRASLPTSSALLSQERTLPQHAERAMDEQPRMETEAREPAPVEGEDPTVLVEHQAQVQQDQIEKQPSPTPAGPRFKVPLVGQADPEQVGTQVMTAAQDIHSVRRDADALAQTDFGEQQTLEVPLIEALPQSEHNDQVVRKEPSQTRALPGELHDVFDSGAATDFVTRLPEETRALLAPTFGQAANMHLQHAVSEEVGQYRQREAEAQVELEQVRVGLNQQMHQDMTAVHDAQVAVREQALLETERKREEWQHTNQQSETAFQTQAQVRQQQADAGIQNVTQTHEQQADAIMAQAESEAAQQQAQAESEAAAVMARATTSAGTVNRTVMRKPMEGPDTSSHQQMGENDLAAAREEARKILEEMQQRIRDLLSNANARSAQELADAIREIQGEIELFKSELQGYANNIGQQMTLNGNVLLDDINTTIAAAENELSQMEEQLLAGQVTDLEAFELQFETLIDEIDRDFGALMTRIDSKANILEPMYTFCAGNDCTTDVAWTNVDTSFMTDLLGYDPGQIYFPYHTNADRDSTNLFPWEGMAAAGYAEHSALHPANASAANEQAFFGQHWIPAAMGIYQTMLVRTGRDTEWGNFNMQNLTQLPGYQDYLTDYGSPNAAALQQGQYADPAFLAEFGGNLDIERLNAKLPTDVDRERSVAEEFYALAASMYFTGAYVEQPYGFFTHQDRDPNLRGSDNPATTEVEGTDRVGFGNSGGERSNTYYLDDPIQDPRFADGSNTWTQGGGVQPEHLFPGVQPDEESRIVIPEADSHTNNAGLSVRTGPDRSYPAATRVRSGVGVTVLYVSGDWSYVQLPDGTQGWASSSYLN